MKKLMLTLLASGLLGGLANAVIVPVPQTATYPPPGDVLVATKTIAFSNGTTLSGTLLSEVWRTASGTLQFVYQLCNDASSTDVLSRLTIAGFFTSFAPTLSQTVPTAGQTAADNGSYSAPSGTVGFNFSSTGIAAGDCSTYLFVTTNAGSFRVINAGVSDGTTFNVSSFTAAVPDGGSAVALLGIALTGIEAGRRLIRSRRA